MVQVIGRPLSERERLLMSMQQNAPQLRDAFTASMRPSIERKENERLKELTGKDLSGLTPNLKKLYLEKYARTPQHEQIKQALLNKGVNEEDAELYTMLSVGGQTAYVKDLLEKGKRTAKFSDQKTGKDYEDELDEIIGTQDEGLTPSERVKRGQERYSTGLKTYLEAGTKLRSMRRDKDNLSILESLNKTDKLPKDLSRLNVDNEGNLRFPFAASAEAQRYVKTLNEFSSGAKDTFGSRVTNFDLSQYLKRFPTLLNSKEGRRQLLEQMKIVNQINSIYYKNLKDIYGRAGGVRKIDADVAERLAEEKSDSQIEDLVKRFDSIGEFESLPSAFEFKGRKIRNPETGEILQSDGENWNPVQG